SRSELENLARLKYAFRTWFSCLWGRSKMKTRIFLSIVSFVVVCAARAQTNSVNQNPAGPPSAPAKKSASDLEQLCEPIALHPDPLISIMLPAAAYPVEIVQAARFVKDTNNVPKVDEQDWDDNVKAVAKFPDLIAKMDADLSWTVSLGQAFVNQPEDVMDA